MDLTWFTGEEEGLQVGEKVNRWGRRLTDREEGLQVGEEGLLAVDEGQAPVDEVAQVGQQLIVVLGCQVAPLEVGV